MFNFLLGSKFVCDMRILYEGAKLLRTYVFDKWLLSCSCQLWQYFLLEQQKRGKNGILTTLPSTNSSTVTQQFLVVWLCPMRTSQVQVVTLYMIKYKRLEAAKTRTSSSTLGTKIHRNLIQMNPMTFWYGGLTRFCMGHYVIVMGFQN